jgi:hypothetical protein
MKPPRRDAIHRVSIHICTRDSSRLNPHLHTRFIASQPTPAHAIHRVSNHNKSRLKSQFIGIQNHHNIPKSTIGIQTNCHPASKAQAAPYRRDSSRLKPQPHTRFIASQTPTKGAIHRVSNPHERRDSSRLTPQPHSSDALRHRHPETKPESQSHHDTMICNLQIKNRENVLTGSLEGSRVSKQRQWQFECTIGQNG